MKKWLRLLLSLALIVPSLPRLSRAEEQPPYEVKDAGTAENFRRIYYDVDKLSIRTSGNSTCIDEPTFCVNTTNHSVNVSGTVSVSTFTLNGNTLTAVLGTRTFDFPDVSANATLAYLNGVQTFTGAKTFSASMNITNALNVTGRAIFTGSSVDVGSAGTATNLDVYPATTGRGVLRLAATDNAAGDPIVTVTNASHAASRTYTIPDVSGNSTFLMTAASQTVTGRPIFPDSHVQFQETGGTDVVTLGVAALAASRTYTFPDAGGSANIVMSEGDATINGIKSFGSNIKTKAGTSSTVGISIGGDITDGIFLNGSHQLGFAANTHMGYRLSDFSHTWYANSGSWEMDFDTGGMYPAPDNNYPCGRSGFRYTAVWATNGTIQTSSSKQKREMKELLPTATGFTLVDIDTTTIDTSTKTLTAGDFKVPRAILFKWKDKVGKADDQPIVGILGDDLPLEAHAVLPDGTRDPENFYTSSIIGIQSAAIRDLQKRVAALEADLKIVKDKLK